MSSEENPFGEGISIEDVEFPDNESKNVENSEIPSLDDDLSLDNFAGDSFSLDDLDLPEIADSSDDSAESGGDDFGMGDMTDKGGMDEAMPGDSFSADDLNMESGGDDFGLDSLNTDSVSSSSSETGLGDDFPNFDLNDLDSGSTSENIEDAGPIESFDISEMDEYVDKIFYSKEEADNYIENGALPIVGLSAGPGGNVIKGENV